MRAPESGRRNPNPEAIAEPPRLRWGPSRSAVGGGGGQGKVVVESTGPRGPGLEVDSAASPSETCLLARAAIAARLGARAAGQTPLRRLRSGGPGQGP